MNKGWLQLTTFSEILFCRILISEPTETMDEGDERSFANRETDGTEEGPVNVIKWCEDAQSKALVEELKSEKYGITKRERKQLKKYLGYTQGDKGEKRMKNNNQAGWYTRLALDLNTEQKEEEEEKEEDAGGDTPFFGRLPTIFSQVSFSLRC